MEKWQVNNGKPKPKNARPWEADYWNKALHQTEGRKVGLQAIIGVIAPVTELWFLPRYREPVKMMMHYFRDTVRSLSKIGSRFPCNKIELYTTFACYRKRGWTCCPHFSCMYNFMCQAPPIFNPNSQLARVFPLLHSPHLVSYQMLPLFPLGSDRFSKLPWWNPWSGF